MGTFALNTAIKTALKSTPPHSPPTQSLKAAMRAPQLFAALVFVGAAVLLSWPAEAADCGSISQDDMKGWLKECGEGSAVCDGGCSQKFIQKAADKLGKVNCKDMSEDEIKTKAKSCAGQLAGKAAGAAKELDMDMNIGACNADSLMSTMKSKMCTY